MYVIHCVLPCKEAKLKPAKKVSYRSKIQAIRSGRSESEEIMLMDGAKCSREIREDMPQSSNASA